jgi:hypothetical protein
MKSKYRYKQNDYYNFYIIISKIFKSHNFGAKINIKNIIYKKYDGQKHAKQKRTSKHK